MQFAGQEKLKLSQPTYKTALELMLSTTPHTRSGPHASPLHEYKNMLLATWFYEINFRSIVWQSMHSVSGADISENSIHHYLQEWANLGQKSGQNMINVIQLSTLENPYTDTLFDLIYIFKILIFLYFGSTN